jgi:hypothetical protein
MICPRNFLQTTDSDIIRSLYLVIPFISVMQPNAEAPYFLRVQSDDLFFMQLDLNWVTDKKSSSILIYFWSQESIYTQENGLID